MIVGKKFLSEDVFVSVDEYRTKKKEDVLFESHRRYIDLQYVMEGEEYIGFSRYPVKEVVPYNVERDITFYNANIEQLLKADAGHFLFFPDRFASTMHSCGTMQKSEEDCNKN